MSLILRSIFHAISIIWQGWVFSCLWLWFFVPLGLPLIGVLWSAGITVTISVITSSLSLKDIELIKKFSDLKTPEAEPIYWIHLLANEFLNPSLFLFLGYVLHLVM